MTASSGDDIVRSGPSYARLVIALTVSWGAVLATGLTWRYFGYAPGQMHLNHEGPSYVYRLVEFVDILRSGQLFPQWASDFRGGLGSPYFGYYQPGLFYAASIFTPFLSPTASLGAVLWLVSLAGFLATSTLVRTRFGSAAGLLAGSALLLSPYPRTELYVRGDLSEYSGMMMVPAALCALLAWLDHGRPRAWLVLAVTSSALVVLHPAVGLAGYGALTLVILCWAVSCRDVGPGVSAVTAMLLGIGLAAFYWVPVALEWSFASGARLGMMAFRYSRHFVEPQQLLGFAGNRVLVSVSLEPVVLTLMVVGAVGFAVGHAGRTAAQRRLVVTLWIVTAVFAFLMTSASAPVWPYLPLLHSIQFPWRLLTIVTATTSMLAGCQSIGARWIAAVGIGALVWTVTGLQPTAPTPFQVLTSAADLRTLNFGPDGVGEWLPKGALSFRDDKVPRDVVCAPACRVLGIDRQQNRLRVRLTTGGTTLVMLPQYFFGVGWRVTLDGVPLDVAKTPQGLFLLTVPAVRNGVIDAQFSMTPMRRVGVAVSAAALAVWLALLASGRAGWPRREIVPSPSTLEGY